MIVGILILLIFIALGLLVGSGITIPYSLSQYIAVAILACLDSVFGAFLASTEKKFKMITFLSGFFGNAFMAMFLVYLGVKLNVDIYLAAIIVFGSRLLNNFSSLRRDAMDSLDQKGKKKKEDQKKYTQLKEKLD